MTGFMGLCEDHCKFRFALGLDYGKTWSRNGVKLRLRWVSLGSGFCYFSALRPFYLTSFNRGSTPTQHSYYYYFTFCFCFFQPMDCQAEELKAGSVVVTFTKGLDSKRFQVVLKRRFDMSWGKCRLR